MGRPSLYTKELSDKICDLIIEGYGLREIAAQDGMPDLRTIFRWRRDNPEFCHQYEEAKAIQTELSAEELVRIADKPLIGEKRKNGPDGLQIETGDNVARSRLQIETRKWVAMKLLPRKYGSAPSAQTDQAATEAITATIAEWHRQAKEAIPQGATDDKRGKSEAGIGGFQTRAGPDSGNLKEGTREEGNAGRFATSCRRQRAPT